MAGLGGIKAGSAFVELGLRDTTGRALNAVSRRFTSFGNTLTRIFRGGMLGAGMAAGIMATVMAIRSLTAALSGLSRVIRFSVMAASTLEEKMNVFNVAFGESAERVFEWVKVFGDSMGRSRKFMVESAASFRYFATQLGLGGRVADEMAQSLTALSVDLGSFWEMADEDVAWRLRSALQGNHEAVRLLNIALSDKMIQQYANALGLVGTKLDENQKRLIRYNLIIEQTRMVQGDAARTIGSFANQMKVLDAQVRNTAVQLGTALMPYAKEMVAWFIRLARAIARNPQVLEQFVKWLAWTGGQVWDKVSGWTRAFLDFSLKVQENFLYLVDQILGMVQKLYQSGMSLGDATFGTFMRIVGKIGDEMQGIFQNLFRVMSWATSAISDDLSNWYANLADKIPNLGGYARDFANAYADTIKNGMDKGSMQGFRDSLRNYRRYMMQFTGPAARGFSDMFQDLADTFPPELKESLENIMEEMKREGAIPEVFPYGKGVDIPPGAKRMTEAMEKFAAAVAPTTIFRGAVGSTTGVYNIQAQQMAKKQLDEMKKMSDSLSSIEDSMAELGAV